MKTLAAKPSKTAPPVWDCDSPKLGSTSKWKPPTTAKPCRGGSFRTGNTKTVFAGMPPWPRFPRRWITRKSWQSYEQFLRHPWVVVKDRPSAAFMAGGGWKEQRQKRHGEKRCGGKAGGASASAGPSAGLEM